MRCLTIGPSTLLLLLLWAPAFADDAYSNPKLAFYVAPADLGSLGADEARNVDKVRQGYIGFMGGSLQSIESNLAEGMSWRMLGPGDGALFKEYSDANVRDWFNTLASFFKYDYMHINSFVVQGDTVVALGSEHGTGKLSGREFNNNWVQVWTFHEGKVVQFRSYEDTNTLLLVMQPR